MPLRRRLHTSRPARSNVFDPRSRSHLRLIACSRPIEVELGHEGLVGAHSDGRAISRLAEGFGVVAPGSHRGHASASASRDARCAGNASRLRLCAAASTVCGRQTAGARPGRGASPSGALQAEDRRRVSRVTRPLDEDQARELTTQGVQKMLRNRRTTATSVSRRSANGRATSSPAEQRAHRSEVTNRCRRRRPPVSCAGSETAPRRGD